VLKLESGSAWIAHLSGKNNIKPGTTGEQLPATAASRMILAARQLQQLRVPQDKMLHCMAVRCMASAYNTCVQPDHCR
jgi:hypothetical protein